MEVYDRQWLVTNAMEHPYQDDWKAFGKNYEWQWAYMGLDLQMRANDFIRE